MDRPFLLLLEFDGTDFCGWQRQTSGRSVQLVVEGALSELAGNARRAIGAGRTDAGVHACALPVSCQMPHRWTCSELLRALNALLPADLAVREVRALADGRDARRAAIERRYHYDITADPAGRSPWRCRTSWFLPRPLDLEAMQRSAQVLIGRHDCRAFAAVGTPRAHYWCDIREARWELLSAGVLRFAVGADRFLYHMVRMLVGTMVDIGRGRRPEADMAALLARTDNAATSAPAPARGLWFRAAQYPGDYLREECATC